MQRHRHKHETGQQHEVGRPPPEPSSSTDASGANTVLARPATSVNVVSARTRWSPPQWVSAANAGGYNVPAIATPVNTQPEVEHDQVRRQRDRRDTWDGDQRTRRSSPGGAVGVDVSSDPEPAPPEQNWASEKAPATATLDQPVSALIDDCRAAKA